MSNTITPTVFYQTLNMEGLEIFYREAGSRDAPTVLLLNGFPSSSHLFRNLIPMLADKYHVVAPDFPGYGESSAPSITNPATEALQLTSEFVIVGVPGKLSRPQQFVVLQRLPKILHRVERGVEDDAVRV